MKQFTLPSSLGVAPPAWKVRVRWSGFSGSCHCTEFSTQVEGSAHRTATLGSDQVPVASERVAVQMALSTFFSPEPENDAP
jgi:hypothetical protein